MSERDASPTLHPQETLTPPSSVHGGPGTSLDDSTGFRELIDGIAAIVWESDADRSVHSFVSHFAERMLGFPIWRWIHEPHFWIERVHHDDRVRTILASRRAAAEGRNHELEYRIVAEDGQIFWVRDLVQVVRSKDGRAVRQRGVMTDVTTRKRAESALTVRARQQAAVAELGHRALSGHDADRMMQDTAELVAAALDADSVDVALPTGDGAMLVARATAGAAPKGPAPPQAADTQAFWAFETGQAVISDDLEEETRFRLWEALSCERLRSGISVVIPGELQAVGVISAYSRARRSFRSHDMHFMQAVAHLLATALERQTAVASLAESERRFNVLATIAPVGIIQTDPDGVCRYVNERWCALTGKRCADARGVPWMDAVAKDDRSRVRSVFRQALARRQPFEVETRLTGAGNEPVWVLAQAQPEQGADGAVVGWVGTVTDITELKRAEEALRESQRTIAALMADLPGIAYRCLNDAAWTMELVSEGSLELLGYRPEDLVQNQEVTFAELIFEDDREMVRSEVEAALAKQQPYRLSYRVRTRGGVVRWVWEQGRAVFDEAGAVIALEGFITDITERKQLEEQLRQSQKLEAIGRLAGGVAHDFNNLLTAILGFSVLVMTQLGEQHPLWRRVNEIKKAADRAASLTNQLLAFSRSQILQPRVLDLFGVVSDMNEMLQRLIGENIDLVTVRGPNPGKVLADRGQLEQVIVNLVINARDSMPSGGRLCLEVSALEVAPGSEDAQRGVSVGSWVALSVEDSGSGMDASTKSRIFEPFFTTKEKAKGTGLGLATVYGIVKQSGGEIRVESELGEGTRFEVLLPRVEAELERGPSASERPARRGTETVLLVEDDDVVRELAQRVLEMSGYRVIEASRALEALELVKTHGDEIKLLVTDVVMPFMSGGALAERAVALCPEMRVLFISGYTDDTIVQHGVLDRRHAFLQKPFTPNALSEKVREVLDEQRH